MIYILVDTPYEKCFDFFFKPELGYPNFYRLNELLSGQDTPLMLIVPSSPTQGSEAFEKVKQTILQHNIKHHFFGENISTTFLFDTKGMANTHPDFQAALIEAVSTFLQEPTSRPKPF